MVKKSAPISEESDRQPGFLKLIAIPPAEAFIDGKSVGWTLINIKLSEGTHRIKLRYQSGEEKMLSQTISAGRVSQEELKISLLSERFSRQLLLEKLHYS